MHSLWPSGWCCGECVGVLLMFLSRLPPSYEDSAGLQHLEKETFGWFLAERVSVFFAQCQKQHAVLVDGHSTKSADESVCQCLKSGVHLCAWISLTLQLLCPFVFFVSVFCAWLLKRSYNENWAVVAALGLFFQKWAFIMTRDQV